MDQSDRYRLLFEVGSAFAAQLDLEALIPVVIDRCRELWGAEGAALLLLDPTTDELYFPYVADDDSEVGKRLRELRFPSTQGIAGAVISSGRSEAVADVAGDPRFYKSVDAMTGARTRSMLVAPLGTRRGTLGVIEIVNPQTRGASTREDLDFLDALAGSIAIAIDNARMVAELRAREEKLRSTVGVLRRDIARQDRFTEIVGASPGIQEVLRLMESAASSPISVLIEGETGTGKELVARGIHAASDRADAPFVAVNCAALPADLLEAELFGHARGAFTGAVAERRGLFEAAHGGSILLDEIGELPLTMQVKLLRVLQEGEVMAVGTSRARAIDVRIIAATNLDLRAAVAGGTFRADLYYRVSAFPIALPPLRARREDIPLLADQFVRDAAERHRKTIVGIAPDAFAQLSRYDWPGNIRELKNEIERAVVLTRANGTIEVASLSAGVQQFLSTPGTPQTTSPASHSADTPPATGGNADLRDARAAFEARFIAEQLEKHGGNVSRTAAAIGISRVMLQKKMKDYGLR
jgi:transcriptional regulator with GAF, ATPase, and Fis domain